MGVNKLVAFSCMSLTLACAGVAEADSFSNGQFVTYSQNDWGSGTVAPSILTANYDTVFASTNDVLVVGVIEVQNQYFISFSGVDDVFNFIPTAGSPAPLTSDLENPTSSPSGIFGGDVVALDLNVAFSNAGLLGTSSIPFGDLVLTDFTGSLSGLNGLTVSEFLALANTCLSDGSCPYGVDNVAAITDELNFSFESGSPSTFADSNLALPSSGTPTTTPEPSSLLLLTPALASLAFLQRRRILRI